MTQDRPTFHRTFEDLTSLAAGLGLPVEAIAETKLPVEVVSTGVPQMMVPVLSLAEIQGLTVAGLDVRALNQACREAGTECVLVFTLETSDPETSVHVRLFAPLLGVPEDPATGSANGALGAYLVRHQAVPIAEGTTHITSRQGMEMDRPSLLYVEVDHTEGEPRVVRVGGHVVAVAEGVVRF